MRREIVSKRNVRWLVAETLVVVLGILIALGLDDFRTDRFERKLEIEYIERLQGDIERDLEYIEAVWKPRLKMKREALESVAPVIRGESPVPDDVEKFLADVSLGGALGMSATLWYTDTTFQDLRATGNFRLIQDSAVRARVSEHYELLAGATLGVERRFSGYALFVHTVIPAEMRSNIDLESMQQFGIDYALQRLLTDEFRNIFNQEYNLLLFMESRPYEPFSQSFYEELEAYRDGLK